jgi:hypothetical protein
MSAVSYGSSGEAIHTGGRDFPSTRTRVFPEAWKAALPTSSMVAAGQGDVRFCDWKRAGLIFMEKRSHETWARLLLVGGLFVPCVLFLHPRVFTALKTNSYSIPKTLDSKLAPIQQNHTHFFFLLSFLFCDTIEVG